PRRGDRVRTRHRYLARRHRHEALLVSGNSQPRRRCFRAMTPLRRLLVLPALLLVLAAPAAGASQPTRGVVVIETALGYQQTSAAGTGFVLTSGGKVLTNNHVIRGATQSGVLAPGPGRRYTASVRGYSVTGDVAVLQLQQASGIPTARIGSSAGLQRGHAVTAVGNAGGARR